MSPSVTVIIPKIPGFTSARSKATLTLNSERSGFTEDSLQKLNTKLTKRFQEIAEKPKNSETSTKKLELIEKVLANLETAKKPSPILQILRRKEDITKLNDALTELQNAFSNESPRYKLLALRGVSNISLTSESITESLLNKNPSEQNSKDNQLNHVLNTIGNTPLLSRDQAETILKGQTSPSFLIRQSARDKDTLVFSCTGKENGQIQHITLENIPAKENTQQSIKDYLQTNFLEEPSVTLIHGRIVPLRSIIPKDIFDTLRNIILNTEIEV